MAIEQRIFDNVEAGKRVRNYHHKTGGSKDERIARYQRFLRAVKLAEENGEKRYLSRLQAKYNVGKFRADLLPTDLLTRTYEDITLEYAEAVMDAVTADRMSRKQQEVERPQATEKPTEIIVVPKVAIDLKKATEAIIAATDEFKNKMNKILTDLTNQL